MTKRVAADKNDWETGAEIYLGKQFIAKQVAVANNGVHSWPNERNDIRFDERNWGDWLPSSGHPTLLRFPSPD